MLSVVKKALINLWQTEHKLTKSTAVPAKASSKLRLYPAATMSSWWVGGLGRWMETTVWPIQGVLSTWSSRLPFAIDGSPAALVIFLQNCREHAVLLSMEKKRISIGSDCHVYPILGWFLSSFFPGCLNTFVEVRGAWIMSMLSNACAFCFYLHL